MPAKTITLILLYLVSVWACTPGYQNIQKDHKKQIGADWLEKRLEAGKKAGLRPGNGERVIWQQKGEPTFHAFLYIHGFGASRAEGEYVVDRLAKQYKLNALYARLPGHGTNKEDHARARFEDYLRYCEQALEYTRKFLGRNVILIGSSTGALLASWLGAENPGTVSALILTSPLWDFQNKSSRIFAWPGGTTLVELIYGDIRDTRWKGKAVKRIQPGYYKHWYADQYFSAVCPLNDLRRFIVREETLSKIRSPLLLMYYEKDANDRDQVVDLDFMKNVYKNWITKPAFKKEVAIADGNHILLSEYVRTDKETILREITTFLDQIITPTQK